MLGTETAEGTRSKTRQTSTERQAGATSRVEATRGLSGVLIGRRAVGGRVADARGKVRSGWEGSRGQEDPGVVRGEAVVVMVIAIEMQGVGGGGGVARIRNLEVGYSPTNLEARSSSDTPWLVRTRDSFGSCQGSVGAPKQRNRPKWTTSLGGKVHTAGRPAHGRCLTTGSSAIPPRLGPKARPVPLPTRCTP